MIFRSDNRAPEQIRPVNIVPDFISTAEGSALIEMGNTRVICTASVEETVPAFLRNSGKGWIAGAFVALGLALQRLVDAGTLTAAPIKDFVAAISVGIVDGEVLLDLNYEEDSRADVDMNFVMTAGNKIVELQATAEHQVFDDAQLAKMMSLARQGIQSLIAKQQALLGTLALRQ